MPGPGLGWSCHRRPAYRLRRPNSSWTGGSKQAKDTFQKAKESFDTSKTIWRPIPIALGLAVMATVGLFHASRREARRMRRVNDEHDPAGDDGFIQITGPWQFQLYATLPLRAISRLWGQMNEVTVPTWLRPIVYGLYATSFRCNVDEARVPDLKAYPNLAAFFYRELKPGARPIDTSADVTSPADGTVLHFGIVSSDRKIEQIKGMTYSLDAFLGRPKQACTAHTSTNNTTIPGPSSADDESSLNPDTTTVPLSLDDSPDPCTGSHAHLVSKDHFASVNTIDYSLERMMGESTDTIDTKRSLNMVGDKALFFVVVYLAPGDYHRFHSPTDWVVDRRRHFAGELFSVSPKVVRLMQNLFVLNERVVLLGHWRYGMFSMIPIGATNVGSIRINFDETLKTNLAHRHRDSPHLPGTYSERVFKDLKLKRGQEIGGFQLGSTVALVFEAPKTFRFCLEEGQSIRVGQAVGSV
ncbi:phosphatidylserine decarboxylase [Synchytrium endobioticum]|nr:phosphatidylserine decarboxylase [Synchytrium endobioticum]